MGLSGVGDCRGEDTGDFVAPNSVIGCDDGDFVAPNSVIHKCVTHTYARAHTHTHTHTHTHNINTTVYYKLHYTLHALPSDDVCLVIVSFRCACTKLTYFFS